MGEGQHKIKRKAEQIACNEALIYINANTTTIANKDTMNNITISLNYDSE
jgi:hypothetical protein